MHTVLTSFVFPVFSPVDFAYILQDHFNDTGAIVICPHLHCKYVLLL